MISDFEKEFIFCVIVALLFINPLSCVIIMMLKSSLINSLENYNKLLIEYLRNDTDTKEIELKRKEILNSIGEIEKIEISFINFKTIKLIWKVK